MGSQMKRCIIAGAAPYTTTNVLKSYVQPGDFLIAADGGQRLFAAMGLTPDFLVSDFDSSADCDSAIPQLVLPTHKDDTDTLAALRYALSQGYTDFVLLGCLGGRTDHTLANIMLLHFLQEQGATGVLADENQEIRLLSPGTYHIPPKSGYCLSLLPYGGEARGVTLRGLVYPLINAVLSLSYPIGISNEFLASEAEITFLEGNLLLILAKDP